MKKNTKKGFTIVELVIVIAVIAILAAVLIPTFTSVIQKAKESAALQQARSGMQTMLIATDVNLPENSQFLISEDNDGAIDYKYEYADNQLQTLDGASEPVAKHGTSPADYYVAYVSADQFTLDVDGNVDTTSGSIMEQARKMLIEAVGGTYAAVDRTAVVSFSAAKDYAEITLDGNVYHVYWDFDIKSSLIVMIAPSAGQVVTPGQTTVSVTVSGDGTSTTTSVTKNASASITITVTADGGYSYLINGTDAGAVTVGIGETTFTITLTAEQTASDVTIVVTKV